MNKYIRSLLYVILLFFCNFTFCQKIGFIDEEKVLASIVGYNNGMIYIDSIKKVMSNEFVMLNERNTNKINSLIKSYNVQKVENFESIYKILSPNDRKKMDELKEEQETLRKSVKLKEDYLRSEFDSKVLPILNKVNNLVKDYCIKNKIVALYKIDKFESGMAYVDDKIDITRVIINLLNGSK